MSLVRTKALLVVLVATVGVVAQEGRANALTGAEALAIAKAVKEAYSAYQDLQSLINGKDVSVATLIENAKTAIINEIHGVVEMGVENDIEASIRDWREITQTLQAFPQNNNAIMQGRISILLSNTQYDWVTLKNIIEGQQSDVNLVYKALPAFELVTALRVTVMKAMAQLNPPMPVAQDAIDQVLIDALQVSYNAIGANMVSYAGPPLNPDPRVHLHASSTTTGKALFKKYLPNATYSCQIFCAPIQIVLVQPLPPGVSPYNQCNPSFIRTQSCQGTGCGSASSVCGDLGANGACPNAAPFPDSLTGWGTGDTATNPVGGSGTFVNNSCRDNSGSAVYTLMSADNVVTAVRETMRAIIAIGQVGPSNTWKPKFYTVSDPLFVGAGPGYLLPIPQSPNAPISPI